MEHDYLDDLPDDFPGDDADYFVPTEGGTPDGSAHGPPSEPLSLDVIESFIPAGYDLSGWPSVFAGYDPTFPADGSVDDLRKWRDAFVATFANEISIGLLDARIRRTMNVPVADFASPSTWFVRVIAWLQRTADAHDDPTHDAAATFLAAVADEFGGPDIFPVMDWASLPVASQCTTDLVKMYTGSPSSSPSLDTPPVPPDIMVNGPSASDASRKRRRRPSRAERRRRLASRAGITSPMSDGGSEPTAAAAASVRPDTSGVPIAIAAGGVDDVEMMDPTVPGPARL